METLMPTLHNGGILLPILTIIAALCYAGMRHLVDSLGTALDNEEPDPHPKEN